MNQPWGTGLPLIGKSLAKFGKVGEIFATPCSIEPQIWVRAFWIGAAKAAWSLAKPTALSPHGSPASLSVFGKHGRTSRITKSGPVAPRYAFNGELMPGPALEVPPGDGWAMWNVPIQLIRRAGWYMLVFDATATGLLNWVSTAYQYAGCPVSGLPFLYGVMVPNPFHGSGVVGSVAGFNPFQNNGVNFGGGTFRVPANSTWSAGVAVQSKPVPGLLPFTPLSSMLNNNTTGQTYPASPLQTRKDGTTSSVTMAAGQIAGQTEEIVHASIIGSGGWADAAGTILWVQVAPFNNILADP